MHKNMIGLRISSFKQYPGLPIVAVDKMVFLPIARDCMKRLISNWFRNSSSPVSPSRPSLQEREISIVLAELQSRKVVLDLRLESHSPVYQTIIRETSLESRSLIIEDVFPPLPPRLLRQGRAIELARQNDGLNISLQSHYIETLNLENDTAYKLQYPGKMSRKQRRNAYRVTLDRFANVKVVSDGPGSTRLFGTAENLSYSGIKLRIGGSVTAKEMANLGVLANCIIRLSSTEEIECDLEISHLSRAPGNLLHTVIGGKLQNISAQHERVLTLFLNNIQRMQANPEYA